MSVLQSLATQHEVHYREAAGLAQRNAWEHEVGCLRSALGDLNASSDWGVILEYELPFEGGRRADVVVLARDAVVPIEFKDSPTYAPAFADQAQAYARDLAEYHSACRDRVVTPLLALPSAHDFERQMDLGQAVSCDRLPPALERLAGLGTQIDLEQWLSGEYLPLPTLIAGAKRIFHDQPLPSIRRAESAGIPEVLRLLHEIVNRARDRGERHLVLVTGVPGSGKTLLGLQFVHELGQDTEQGGIFLSGNDPLVDVLQDALGNKIFVRRMHDYILNYAIRHRPMLPFPVIVFDEAQRAWDVQRMTEKKEHAQSEPDILMEVCVSLPKWGVVVGLVGEGQEIYVGEESGLPQWRVAVERAAAATGEAIEVHLPSALQSTFAGVRVTPDDRLSLTTSLRSHRASDFHVWIAALMDGRLEDAGRTAGRLREAPFELYFTTDLFRAKQYLYARYADEPTKRFGLLASSKSLNLPELGIDTSFQATRRLKLGPWFNAEPSDPRSCCQLAIPMTEFQCQGLELDMPLICWGDDLGWDGQWTAFRRTKAAQDSRQLRINSYRVLLSRGRDGVIVYLPPNLRDGQRERLIEAFLTAGMIPLRAPDAA